MQAQLSKDCMLGGLLKAMLNMNSESQKIQQNGLRDTNTSKQIGGHSGRVYASGILQIWHICMNVLCIFSYLHCPISIC